MQNTLFNRSIISATEITLDDLHCIFKTTDALLKNPTAPLLHNKLIGSCFFEPSTRTRLSFEAAAQKLDGKVIGFSESTSTSSTKGESLQDSIRVITEYVDLIVLRHPIEGAARVAAETATVPVINAGDGANQHPSQALTDLYTMRACQTQLENLQVAIVGDLKYGRAVHSLVQLCTLLKIRLFFVGLPELSLPENLCDMLSKQGVRFSFHQTIEEVIKRVDILYMTRIQTERFKDERIAAPFILTPELLKAAKPNLKVLHPLPRVNEITPDVDKTLHAFYFEQAKYGLYVRQALLALLLNQTLNLEEIENDKNVLCVSH